MAAPADFVSSTTCNGLRHTWRSRGWTAYYRPWSSKRAFKEVDRIVSGQLWQWASRQHRRKGRQWIAARYWDKRIPGSDNRWIFGEGSAYVKPAAMTRIVRHVPVLGTYSKDDPALAGYWTERAARRTKLGLENKFIQTLAVCQRDPS
ncbi:MULTISPECIES: group II intron maturase-specific domain-containing protein [unclassified Streptomyces]|uniref:group II intron maturase-specific domain-containing protein n=1 Tax=unclassified Streptomyces TaxID=2593676 RepID=UPI001CBC8729|nr:MULTISPECIES: group II intron maturase-specific domain-containing protein [unclassified Streptomyces]WPO75693.1 group II intron maturase-specific domain-containing protein [Streptomyces sp. KN37]